MMQLAFLLVVVLSAVVFTQYPFPHQPPPEPLRRHPGPRGGSVAQERLRRAKDKKKISIEKDAEHYGGGSTVVTMDATVIPWGYMPGHEAFGHQKEADMRQASRVLDGTNQPEVHDNHAFIMSTFENSTLFNKLEYDHINKFLWNRKPLFIVMLCNCERDSPFGLDIDPSSPASFESRLGRYKNEFNFIYILPKDINEYNLITTFDVDMLPTVIIDNIPLGLNNDKYVIGTDTSSYMFRTDSEYAVTQLMEFVRGFSENSIPRVVRSELPHPLPWDEPEKMWDLVGSNFKPVVIDDDSHDVLLLVYSPNCPACRAIMPIFADLAVSLSPYSDKIRVATFDKSANDFPIGGLQLKVYPTVYFFPATHKYESINFYDFRTFHFTEEGLLHFVRQHAENVFDYDLVLDRIRNKPEKPYDGDCTVLTADTYQRIVKDPSKDVFVDYYAPWCAYCKMLTPTWEELCSVYKNHSTIVIALFDCAKYESFAQSLRIHAFPTMLFYTQSKKSQPYAFRSNRDLNTLRNFIESKKTTNPLPEIEYGDDLQAFRKEEPCVLRNGHRMVNLTRITEMGDQHDDFRVTSENGEYDFFVALCHGSKRRCVNKDFDYPIIQLSTTDPQQHCYYLGRSRFTHAFITEGGDEPVSIVRYLGGEPSDDFRDRTTEIMVRCVPDLKEDEFRFVGEVSEVGSIVYQFELKSRLGCNVN